MANLSPAQIFEHAIQAGFNTNTAVIATAVALAESGGNPNARCHNCVTGVTEDSRGLWQINVDAHPQYASWNLYDPQTNALAAFQVSNGGKNFAPWSTYTSGAYKAHIQQATNAVVQAGVSGGDIGGTGTVGSSIIDKAESVFSGITDTASAIVAIGKFFEHLTEDLFSVGWWKRVGIAAIGVTMIGVGIGIIIEPEAGKLIGQAGGAAGAARGSASGAGESAGGVIGEAAETAAVA
jgi:hypothetical protein